MRIDKSKLLVWADLLMYYGILVFCATIPFSIGLATGGLFGGTFGWFLRCVLRGQIAWKPTPLDGVILIFLAVQAASVVFSVDRMRSLDEFRSYWHLLPFLLLVQGDFSDKRVSRAAGTLVIAGVLAALLGIGQHFLQRSSERICGTFSIYMTYAGILSLIWAMTINQAIRADITKRRRLLYFLALLVITFAVGLSATRIAFLSILAACAVLLAIRLPKTFLASAVVATLILTAVPWARQKTLSVLWGTQTPLLDTNVMIPWADQRPFLWKGAWRILKNHPWTGVGLSNYPLEYKKYLPYDLPKSYNHAHNNLLHLGAETGIPGLAAFLLFSLVALVFLFRSYGKAIRQRHRALIGGGLCAFAGFQVAGLFEYNFGDAEVALLFWCLLGLAVVSARNSALDLVRTAAPDPPPARPGCV